MFVLTGVLVNPVFDPLFAPSKHFRVVSPPPCGELPPSRTDDRHQARLDDADVVWTLPGKGEATDRCGEPFLVGCLRLDGVHHKGRAWVQVRAHQCKRRECPDDYEAWADFEARKAARRMQRGIELLGEGLASHVVFAPPQAQAIEAIRTHRGYARLRAQAYQAARAVGYRGGALVFHPWRALNPKTGKRVGGARLQADAICVDGPHFHGTVTGWNEDVAAFYARTGWVVRRVRVLEDEADVVRVLAYALKHCGVGKTARGRSLHALTWWGSFAVNKLRLPEVVVVDREDVCPHCEAPMGPVTWVDLDRPPPTETGWVDADAVAVDFEGYMKALRADDRRHTKDLIRRARPNDTGPDWGWEFAFE